MNEDSSCPKLAYDGKPGSFISTQPCTDPRAPKPRFLFLSLGLILTAAAGVAKATTAVVGAGAAVGAAVGSAHIAKAVKNG